MSFPVESLYLVLREPNPRVRIMDFDNHALSHRENAAHKTPNPVEVSGVSSFESFGTLENPKLPPAQIQTPGAACTII